MINLFILQGRLTKDPELKTTTSGISVATFSVAWNKKTGEDTQRVLYVDCEAWRGTADLIYKNFKKGNEILVEGELYTNIYENENGEKKHNQRLIVNQVHFTFGNNKQENVQNNASSNITPIDDDNLPF